MFTLKFKFRFNLEGGNICLVSVYQQKPRTEVLENTEQMLCCVFWWYSFVLVTTANKLAHRATADILAEVTDLSKTKQKNKTKVNHRQYCKRNLVSITYRRTQSAKNSKSCYFRPYLLRFISTRLVMISQNGDVCRIFKFKFML